MASVRGGCLCGAIRYELKSIFDSGYCHCTICRRLTGAPVLSWVAVHARDFKPLRGAPSSFASSPHGTRWFCADCGGHVYTTDSRSDYVSVGLGTLDDPASVEPKIHMWTESRLPWFRTADSLPQVPGGTLPHPTRR